MFSNASMLEKGDDVRVAGVSVGEVKEVEHYKRNQALVTFKIKSDVPLTTTSRAEIRFLNLVGDRYLALEAGDGGDSGDISATSATATAMRAATRATAPRPPEPGWRTGTRSRSAGPRPALDLTTLFNGFKPLFQALQPDQVNELSMNLVQVLQGEGGTVQEPALQDGLPDQRPGRPRPAHRRRRSTTSASP